jgi:hypothetical protein
MGGEKKERWNKSMSMCHVQSSSNAMQIANITRWREREGKNKRVIDAERSKDKNKTTEILYTVTHK